MDGSCVRVGELYSVQGLAVGWRCPPQLGQLLLRPSHGRSGSDHFESHTIPMCLSCNRALHPVQESSNALGNSYHFSLALHSAFDKQLPLAKSDAKILVLATELSM